MKKMNLVFLIFTFLLNQSCQGQNVDLEKLVLPVNPIQLKILDLTDSGSGVGTESVQYSSYFSDKGQSLSFGGVPLGNETQTNAYTGSIIRAYKRNNVEGFQGYTLNVKNPGNFAKVLSYFLKNKNKFKLAYDDGNDNSERARIFNCQENKTIYLVLSVNNNGKKSGYIDAVNEQEIPLLTSRLGGAFGYYNEYLEYRKHKSTNVSYLDFLKETDNAVYKATNNLK